MDAFFGSGAAGDGNHPNDDYGAAAAAQNNPILNLLRAVTGGQGGVQNMAAAAAEHAAAYAGQAAQGIFDPQPQRQQPSGPPPASAAALRQLPTVSVTPEDLVEPSNRECCICFDEHNINDKVVRLPCAHIYHPGCVTEWLEKHCTCPTCRYELPTEDPDYEKGRRERMRSRKPRYAKYELQRMSIRELKSLLPLRQHRMTRQVTDKTDLVEYIISKNIVDVINTPPPVEFPSLAVLRAMGVGQLKRTMNDCGVYFDPKDVVEKEDMIQIFVNSGRICLELAEEGESYDTSYGFASRTDSVGSEDTTTNSSNNNNDDDDDDEPPDNSSHLPTATATTTTNVTTNSSHSGGIVVETVGTDEEDDANSPRRSFHSSHRNNPLSRHNWDSNRVMEETQFGAQSAAAAAAAAATAAAASNTTATGTAHQQSTEEAHEEADDEELMDTEEAHAVPETETQDNPDPDTASNNSGDARTSTDDSMDASEPAAAAVPSVASVPTLNDDANSDAMDVVNLNDRRKRRRQQESVDATDQLDGTSQFQNLSINELRTIAREQGVNVSNCIERREMIERLSSASSYDSQDDDDDNNNNNDNNNDNSDSLGADMSSSIDEHQASSSDTHAVMQLSQYTFQGWSVSQLRACAQAVDVDFSHCTDQDQMIDNLLVAASERPYVADFLAALSPLMTMNISQLRALAREWQVGVSDCLEKGEIIRRLAVSAADRR